jgi:twinkle protein
MLTDLLKNGVHAGTDYLVKCPLCGEPYAMHIYPGDVWRCVSCNRSGDEATLRELMGDDLMVLADKLNKPKPPEGLIVVSDYIKPRHRDSVPTGFNPLDRMLGGLAPGMLTVMTGKRGEGKSTLAGQMALHMVDAGHRICFYSGELNAGTFRDWIVNQAAGPKHIESYDDSYGETRYRADQWIEQRILAWLGDKLILYDNGIVKSSERNSILERFTTAQRVYRSDVFVVDNLMTARMPTDSDRDFYRAQSNFVRDLTEFAIQHDSHVILIAHPRKSSTSDRNDDVAGAGDITNLASNVMAVSKKADAEWDSEVEITKNRQYGAIGAIRFNFDRRTRRFILVSGQQVDRLGWEDEV